MNNCVKPHHTAMGLGWALGRSCHGAQLPACLAEQGLGGARHPLCLCPGAGEPRPLLQQSGLRGSCQHCKCCCCHLVWPRPAAAGLPVTPVCCIPFPWRKEISSPLQANARKMRRGYLTLGDKNLMLKGVPKPLFCLCHRAGRVLCVGNGKPAHVHLQASCKV